MTWLRIDDGKEIHPKVASLSDSAHRLWSMAAGWCSRYRTNGFVPETMLAAAASNRYSKRILVRLANELVEAKAGGLYKVGLWEPVEGGWVFHDWHEYNPTLDRSDSCGETFTNGQASDAPRSRSEAARIAGKASAEARRNRNGSAQPMWQKSAETDGETIDQPQDVTRTTFDDVRNESFERRSPNVSNVSELEPEPPDPDPLPDQINLKPVSKDLTGYARTPPAAPTPDPVDLVAPSNDCQSAVLPPVTAPTTSAATSQPPPVSRTRQKPILDDPFRRSLEPQTELVEQLFEAWREEAGKPGATLDGRGLQFWRRLAHEGVTVEQVRDAMRGAKLDDWARDTAQLAPSPILGSAEQRLKFIGIGKSPPAPKGARRPKQPTFAGGFAAELLAHVNGGGK